MELFDTIDRAEERFVEQESLMQAFLPEAGRFERLHREAAELLKRFPDPETRPPLFGMLVGVKDILRVDGFETSAGSLLPPRELRGEEAQCVSRLRQRGALIAGKTVTTEFAYFAPGPTRNPRNPEHTPGGSSSGSAAAVAAGLCEFALGTQTIGSIIRPASFCGIVGLKPSYGRISTEGVIPLSPTLDHVGFFTRDISTTRRVAPCLYEEWNEPDRDERRPVLGIPEGPFLGQAWREALDSFRATCRALVGAGYELRYVPAMADLPQIREIHNLILAAEAARVHATWFSKYERLYAPETAALIRRGMAVPETELETARKAPVRLREGLQSLMDSSGIDLWITPSTLGAAPRGLESTGDPAMNLPWTQAGLPAINLPAYVNHEGLPLGLQLIGKWFCDELILGWAADIEQVVRAA